MYEQGTSGLSYVSSKIDENESLAAAKRTAAEKASSAVNFMSSWMGWSGGAQAQPQGAA